MVMNKMSLKEHVEMFWKFFFIKAERTPKTPLPQQQLDYDQLFDNRQSGLKTCWLGHSSLLININGYSILTDPVFERKVTPVGPARFNKEIPINVDSLPPLDIVIISHDHYDHLNKYSIQQLAEKVGYFMVPRGVGRRLIKWSVSPAKVIEFDWWDEFQPTGNLTVASTPAQHFSGRGWFDRNRTLWSSWVIKTPEHRLFFSGDTGYFSGFSEIGDKYGPFDITFLECGAYDSRWSNIHMFPEQTVQAHLDLRGKLLQPIHWATFNLAFHPWYEPVERLIESAWNENIAVMTPMIGSIVNHSNSQAVDSWWTPAMSNC